MGMNQNITSNFVNEMRKTQIDSLYALKAICAFFVVAIHTPLLGKPYIREILDVAVPCFFMISGYFLYSGNKEREIDKAKKWLKKVLIIYAILAFVYLIYGICCGRNFLYKTVIIKIVLFGEIVSVHLWYLTALWQALVIFIFIRKNDRLFFFSPLLFLWRPIVHYSCLYFGIEEQSYFTGNCLGVALPYLCVGYTISKYRYKLQNFKLFILGAILCFMLMKCLNWPIWMLQVILSILVFLATLNYNKKVNSALIWLGKYHSANIYYLHMILVPIIQMLLVTDFLNECCCTICVFVLTLLMSIGVNKILVRLQKSACV